MKAILILSTLTWSALWLTPDQQGQRLFDKQEFKAAATEFSNPMRKATALYRAGEFKQAQAVFSRLDSAEAHYNRGNCLVFLGQYQDAVASYDRALSRRPNWLQSKDNRDLAAIRAERMNFEGGEMGDQQIGADKIVFDKKKEGGQDTLTTDDKPAENSSMQSLWLRRIQTKPADFLKNKFAYQQQFGEEVEE